MAITRAQQVRQMLEDGGMLVKPSTDGKRPGYRSARAQEAQGRTRDTGSDYGQFDRAVSRSQNNPSRTTSSNDGGGGDNKVDVGFQEALRKQEIEKKKKEARDEGFRTTGSQVYSPPTTFQKFKNDRIQNAINRNKYLALQKTGLIPGGGFKGFAGSLIDGLFGKVPENLQDLTEEELTELAFEVQKFKDAGGSINQATYNYNLNPTKKGSGLELLGRTFDAQDLLDSGQMTQTKFEELFPGPDIPEDRDGPEQDPCKGPNPPAYCFLPKEDSEPETPKVDPTPFRFLADGGRAGFQEGGIMPRLNQLGSGVSSAEQMLQEINQRLDSAESSLGEGGGMSGTTIAPNMSPLENAMRGFGSNNGGFSNNFQPRQMPIGQPQPGSANQLPGLASIANYTPFGGETFNQIPEQFRAGFDEYRKENPIGIGGQAISYSMLPDGNRVMFGDTASASGFSDYLNSIGQGVSPVGLARAIQSPLQQAVGMADGGIMDANIVGGMMDGNMDEMGRQMYGLGKLVKKATRAVKKIVKSPVGKIALLAGGAGLLSGGSFGLPSFLKSEGLKKFFLKDATKKFALSNLSQKGLMTGIGALSALPLLFGQDEEEEFDPYRGPDIDIDKIRSDPYGAMRGAYRNYAEGGKAEPVAKKTMPLIDMDGKEKDYRETGGFVDMGRMERADDVPARLSKNEFVFTADAVRNAGEGDIDKGAEVMYNMMKNLEAGGEVSEESQGLEGARNMFQTSQRLGEVI